MQLPLFNFAWFRNFGDALQELSRLAMPEEWDYKRNPTGNYPILFNYVQHTFAKLHSENKIEVETGYCTFDTGLVTPQQEEIFAYFETNRKPNTTIQWYFIGWRKRDARELMRFSRLPEAAHYFHSPIDLIYDTKLELRINYQHIIIDNKSRFPAPYNGWDNPLLQNLLTGAIDSAKKRVKRNYKTAIPQYYNGKIQLLLPICLGSVATADLALVVDRENDNYKASTCLTLDMALNNARLIAKPDDEWLQP